MKNSEKQHIFAILTLCIVGLIMLAVANPSANPVIIHWPSEALRGVIASFGGIFIWIGFIYALVRISFLSEEKKKQVC